MPNPHNIESPVTLIAPGRSGTSLLASVFDRHPDFSFAGETANLVFGSWYAAEFSGSVIPPLVEGGKHVSATERAARAVRQTFLTCVPDDRPHWFHKPLGVPVILPLAFRWDQWSEAAEWYWKVMRASFPKARYITVLRNPCDVVLSSQSYWGYDQATLWHAVSQMSYILGHPSSPVEYAIRFEELVGNSRKVVEDLFAYLEMPFREEVMETFTTVHVPAAGRGTLAEAGTPRRCEWDRLDARAASADLVEPIADLFSKFGFACEMPERFTCRSDTPEAEAPVMAPTPDETIAELQETVAELTHRIEKLHIEHHASLQAQLRKQRDEANRVLRAQREVIYRLEAPERDSKR
jgi:hypothetical protein